MKATWPSLVFLDSVKDIRDTFDVCSGKGSEFRRTPTIYGVRFSICKIVNDSSDLILCDQWHVLFVDVR
eukprot:6698509-Heterocapsa_arctica.AAC.1